MNSSNVDLNLLTAEYTRLFESVINVGEETVCYERETWNAIRDTFAKIIAIAAVQD